MLSGLVMPVQRIGQSYAIFGGLHSILCITSIYFSDSMEAAKRYQSRSRTLSMSEDVALRQAAQLIPSLAEIFLRHQLNVLRRKAPKRVAFNTFDRFIFGSLYRIAL
jgi:hypothetical protein